MAADGHRWDEQLAPYALGMLPEEDAYFLEQHLDTCDPCRAQLRRLREHYGLFDRSEAGPGTAIPAPPAPAAPPAAPAAPVPATASPIAAPAAPPAVTPERLPGRAWRPAATSTPDDRHAAAPAPVSSFTAAVPPRRAGAFEAATAAAAVVVLLVGLVTLASGDREPSGEELAFARVQAGVDAGASLVDEDWGTRIVLEVEGLAPGTVYVVRVRDLEGDLVPAGTFLGASGPIAVELAAAVPEDEVTALVVTERGGDIVLSADR